MNAESNGARLTSRIENRKLSLVSLLSGLLLLVFSVSGCQLDDALPLTGSSTPPVNSAAGDSYPAAEPSTPSPRPTQIDAVETYQQDTSDQPLTTELTPRTRIQIPLAMVDSSTPVPTSVPDYPIYSGPTLDKSDIGIQIHIHREDQEFLLNHLSALDVGWVKVQVSWKIYEPQQGQYDDYRLNELDQMVARANESGIKVMLSVVKAPEWSRTTTEMDGPPSDYQTYTSFMTFLASRYEGKVHAYELWNEANLQREWNGAQLSPADTVALISAGAEGVRATDTGATLISGAPAPTGINDGITAIDDRLFFHGMVTAGLASVVDAIGVHPYGWANPPDSSSAVPDPSIPSHNNHPSFFFADTINDYRSILDQNGHPTIPLWATEFGWGSYEGLGVNPPPGVEYMAYVNEWQQAQYTLRAYEMANDWPGVGPMILWNLNFGPTFGSGFVESAYSLLRPDGSSRPIYHSVTSINKTP